MPEVSVIPGGRVFTVRLAIGVLDSLSSKSFSPDVVVVEICVVPIAIVPSSVPSTPPAGAL